MTDTTPPAVAAMREKLMAGDLCAVELAPEASAMIAALAEERDNLHDKVGKLHRDTTVLADIADNAEAEAARLREALRPFAEVDLTGHGVPHDFALNVLAARAALKENPDD